MAFQKNNSQMHLYPLVLKYFVTLIYFTHSSYSFFNCFVHTLNKNIWKDRRFTEHLLILKNHMAAIVILINFLLIFNRFFVVTKKGTWRHLINITKKIKRQFFLLNGVIVLPIECYDFIKGQLSDSYSVISQV